MQFSRSPAKRIFISYAREDLKYARRLYSDLRRVGAEPWLDTESLLPGQKFDSAISSAIQASDFFLALLSSSSVNKKGYVQKELREAMEILDRMPESGIYIIPARLDNCKPTHLRLQNINWVDLFPLYETGLRKILLTIRPPEAVALGNLRSSSIRDPNDLAQTGWGVIFPEHGNPSIYTALSPLLSRRRAQAGVCHSHFYREFMGSAGYRPGENKTTFLAKHGMGPGPADPQRVPYYLLIVGDPAEIPFEFQCQLGVQYRVGRLHFETIAEYENYARSVEEAETGSPRSRSSVLFGTHNWDESPIKLAVTRLVRPLAESLGMEHPDWSIDILVAEQATKANLLRLFERAPTVLFLIAHGLWFPARQERQEKEMGAIVCQDWPGPDSGKGPNIDHYLSSAQIPDSVDLRGMTLFCFSSYSAGVSRENDYGPARTLQAERSFVSAMAKRILGKSNGALAMIGHINVIYQSSIEWISAGPQIQTFETALRSIFRGDRIGMAMQPFSERYAELSSALIMNTTAEEARDPEELTFLRTAAKDARDYILIGDPAARALLDEQ
jgi:hypothetical protein